MNLIRTIFVCFILASISLISNAQDKVDVLIFNKQYNEALLEIDKLLEKQPSSQFYFKKGLILKSIQNYQEALNSFTSALQFDPDNIDILAEMADGLSTLGNNYDAVTFYKKAICQDTTNLTLSGKLGRVYINQKKLKEAYKVFAKIYQKDSTNTYWNKQFAYCSFKVGVRKQAIRLYEKVIEANARDYGSYSNLVHLYDFRKDGERINELIDKGLDQFPGDAGLILERASYYFKKKDYSLAMTEYEKYFEAGGDPIYEIKMNCAISTYFARNEEKALQLFGELLMVNPRDPFVQFYMSLCNKRLVNYEQAEKMMNWAIESSIPHYVAEMYHHLGQIYGLQRKFKESIEALNESYDLDPSNHEILFEIATTYEEFNSNKTLALNYYRIYLKEAGEGGDNINYALDRITKIKEDLFFDE